MDPFDIILEYYKPRTKLYDIYVSHVTDVAQKAVEITENHPELAVDVRFIYEAAMLHDVGMFLTNAPSIECYGTYPYICHGYLGGELVRQAGYPKHALVCDRHTGIGITLKSIIEKKLPLPHRELSPLSLEEKIICFADKFYSKSQLGREKSLDKIRKGLMKNGKYDVEIFDKWTEMFL